MVRVAALKGLARSHAAVPLREISACLSDPVPEVRTAAIDSLRQQAASGGGIVAQIEPLLADADPLVRARAAQVLLCTAKHDRSREMLHAMVADSHPHLRAQALEALGESGDETAWSLVVSAMLDGQPVVRKAAFGALAAINPTAALPLLIQHLNDEDGSVRCALADVVGGMGEPAVDPLVDALANPDFEDGALMALAHLPAQPAAVKIRAHARTAAQAALHYHGLAQRIGGGVEVDGSIQLLADSLDDQAICCGLNALRALGLVTAGEAVGAAVQNLGSRDAGQRANALETLEAMGEREIVHPLLALWEPLPDAPSTPLPPLREGWLISLLDDPHPWLRACAVMAAAKSADALVRERIESISRADADGFVRALAENVLKGETGMDTLATLSLMDRILFLRRVPLFDGLSPADLKQVAAIAREVLFSDGQVMARQNELGTEMFILVSGEVRVLIATGGQKEASKPSLSCPAD